MINKSVFLFNFLCLLCKNIFPVQSWGILEKKFSLKFFVGEGFLFRQEAHGGHGSKALHVL
jgi:hypothetical protein